MNRRFIVGAGGHGLVVLETWRAAEPESVIGFVDDNVELHGTQIRGAVVVGPLSMIENGEGQAVIAIGNNHTRLRLAGRFGSGVAWGRVVHPSATVFQSAEIGPGCMLLAASVINTGAKLGAHVIVNSGVIVEHHCILEDGVAVSPGACMGGRVHIERGAFISVGVTLAPRVRVGAGTVVGAGAVVVSDLPAGVLAYGVPARVVRSLGDDFNWQRLL